MTTATRAVPDLVLDVLARSRVEGNRLDLPGQLDPKEYQAIKGVINKIGGKWNRAAGTHLWPEGVDVAEVLDPVLLTGKVTDERKLFDAFYTPPDLAEKIVLAADIRPNHIVLEPSAGMGALTIPAARAGGEVVAYELRPLTWAEHGLSPLKINDALTVEAGHIGDGHVTLHMGTDFLTVNRDPIYDRVVMNPPFSNQADMRHVLHAAKFVAAGGRLVAIMSPAFTFRESTRAVEFRAWLRRRRECAIVDLPEGSFKPAGTAIRTVLLVVDL